MFEKRHANASAAAGMITEVTEWWVADRPNAWEQDYERSGSRIISETGIGSGYSSAGIFRDDFPTVGDAQGFVASFGGVGQQVGWVTDEGFSGACVTSTFSGTSSSYQWGPPPPIDWSDEAWEGVNQVEEDMTHHVVENGDWNGGILEVRMRWLGNPPGATGTPVRRSFLLIKEKQTAGMTEPEIESAETHTLTLDPFSGMSGVIRIHADSSENGVTVTERLLPVEVAPDVLAVNSDFDEGRIDPDTGYAIPDCDDIPDVDAKTGDGNTLMALEAVRDHLDGEYAQTERITDDMHEGWFGVNPHLLDDDFWDGATVTIRKLDKDDPDTGRKESGQVRFYAKWGDGDFEYYGIEPYNLDTLAAVNLAQAGINGKPGESVYGSSSNIPENSEFYIEGVRPGKITLEWRYQKGDIDVKHEQTFLVETRLSPEEWKADLAYKIRLDTDNDPSAQIDVNVDPRGAPREYWVRVERMSEYYDYYQENYLVDDDFQWCGMARLAGSQVIGGTSDARKALFLTPSAIVDRIVGELIDSLSEGGFDIFDSLAWQHHVYRSSGLGALEWTNDNSGDNDLAQLIISWRDLDAGLNANDPALIAAAARRMTIYEQQEIIVPTWNKLRAITPVNNEVTNTFTVLAENVMKPNGDRFTVAVPGGDLSNTADRWKWIDDSVTGSPNGIIGAWKAAGKAGQRALVSKTLRIDSARFSLLPGDIEVRDHLDTP